MSAKTIKHWKREVRAENPKLTKAEMRRMRQDEARRFRTNETGNREPLASKPRWFERFGGLISEKPKYFHLRLPRWLRKQRRDGKIHVNNCTRILRDVAKGKVTLAPVGRWRQDERGRNIKIAEVA